MADCDGALDTIERLQRDNAALREVARAVAEYEYAYNEWGYCQLCNDDGALAIRQHYEWCPVTKAARALLADTLGHAKQEADHE
jgi:hypothetical protein